MPDTTEQANALIGWLSTNGIVLAVVPGDSEPDLKALARATGDRSTDVVSLKQVTPLTRYVRGGVTALACRKPYPVFLDESALRFEVISVSAGQRGLQVFLAPGDYARAVSARLGAFGKVPA